MIEFQTKVLKPGEALEMPPRTIQLKPTKLFVFPKGSVEEKMSFAFILSAGADDVVVTQISAKMLIDSMPSHLIRELKHQLTDELVRRVRRDHNGEVQ